MPGRATTLPNESVEWEPDSKRRRRRRRRRDILDTFRLEGQEDDDEEEETDSQKEIRQQRMREVFDSFDQDWKPLPKSGAGADDDDLDQASPELANFIDPDAAQLNSIDAMEVDDSEEIDDDEAVDDDEGSAQEDTGLQQNPILISADLDNLSNSDLDDFSDSDINEAYTRPHLAPFTDLIGDLDVDIDEGDDILQPLPYSDNGDGLANSEQARNQSSPPASSSDSSSSSKSSSSSDSFTGADLVYFGRSEKPLTPELMALGLWMEKSSCSRDDWVRLREIILMLHQGAGGDGTMLSLPLKKDTLLKMVRSQVPMLQMMRKVIAVTYKKLPSLPAQEKNRPHLEISRSTFMYWFDPINLVKTILSATDITRHMYFGLARFHQSGTELWDSLAWGQSNLAVSGRFPLSSKGHHILVGDIVKFTLPPDAIVHQSLQPLTKLPISLGRVIAIYLADMEVDPCIVIEPIVTESQLKTCGMDHVLKDAAPLQDKEMILIGDGTVLVPPSAVQSIKKVKLDYRWDGSFDKENEEAHIGAFIKMKWEDGQLYALRYTNPPAGELEIDYFGRQHIISLACPEDNEYDVKSFPIILFVDDFGVHRNMYRALKAFYWIPGNLPWQERRKLANVFTFTLGPHGASLNDIIGAFRNRYEKLFKGVFMNINGKRTLVVAFVMYMIGDLPQQADNSGCLRHGAKHGCRRCYTTRDDQGDLNVLSDLRYHWDVVYSREEANEQGTVREQKAYFSERGLKKEPPVIAELAPFLDIVRTRPFDIPHSEWRGLGRVGLSLLFHDVMTKAGADAFLRLFQTFPFPPGWQRIQNPIKYMWSWSLTEAGRATIITPLILRCHSEVGWFKQRFLQELEKTRQATDEVNTTDIIVNAYSAIARANTITGMQIFSTTDELEEAVSLSRWWLQRLLDVAEKATPTTEAAPTPDDDSQQPLPEVDNQDVDMEEEENEPAVPTENVVIKSKYLRQKALPNMHLGMHIADNARVFATTMNCSVLAGELKHKRFKQMADKAAPANLLGHLFGKDLINQSLRLGFAGAWTHDYPGMQDPVAELWDKCATLTKSFLPIREHEPPAQDDEDDVVLIANSRLQYSPRADRRGFRAPIGTNTFRLFKDLRLYKCESDRPELMTDLRTALGKYGITGLLDSQLPKSIVDWRQRVGFNNPHGERVVFNIGDFVLHSDVASGLARLDQIFVVDVDGKLFALLVVHPLEQVKIETDENDGAGNNDDRSEKQMIDSVTGLAVYELSVDQQIVALKGLSTKRPFFVPAPERGDWMNLDLDSDDEDGSDEQRYWLRGDWNLDTQ